MAKPRNDDWVDPPLYLGVGHTSTTNDTVQAAPLAVLWLPSPEGTDGWAKHEYRPRRPLGFPLPPERQDPVTP